MKMSIRKKGIERLDKLTPIYVFYEEEYDDDRGREADYRVLYKEKGVVKYAVISNPYYLRYGPSVIATLKSYSPTGLWQQSKDAINDEECERMFKLFKDDTLDLPELDLEALSYKD